MTTATRTALKWDYAPAPESPDAATTVIPWALACSASEFEAVHQRIAKRVRI